MPQPHDYEPLIKFLNDWLLDYMIIPGYNSNSQPSLFISYAVKPVKVETPLFYIDTAVIYFNGVYHVQFLPGASTDNIREIKRTVSHYKIV